MNYGLGVVERLPSGRYRVRVPTGRGTYKSCGTYPTEKEAKRMLAAATAVRTETSITQSVAEYGELIIMRWKGEGKRSWNSDLSRWKCWVCKVGEFAGDPVDMVSRADVKRFARELLRCDSERAEPVSNQTIKHVVNLVRRVFNEAVQTDELIERSPVEGVKVPRRNDAEGDHWTALSLVEIELVRACPTLSLEQRTALLLAVYTGLRQGELAALEWANIVDLDGQAPHIWVRKSWDTTTKTRRARRVELIRPAAELLRAWQQHAAGSPGKTIWGHTYARGYDWGWALTKDQGRGICWLGAKHAAGISRSVWFHHLRDTCASHLLTGSWGRSWTIGEVGQMLGHTTTWVTERYARILPGALAKAAALTTGETSHEPPTPVLLSEAKTPYFQGHAMQGSNLRPSAPEALGSNVISITCESNGSFVGGLGKRYLQLVTQGNGGLEEKAVAALVGASLDALGARFRQLAAQIREDGPDARVAAIEGAGELYRREQLDALRQNGTTS